MKVKKYFSVAINIIAPLTFALTLIFFRKYLSPANLGFYCDDDTINKPYRSSTVPFVAITIIFPVFAAICFIVGKYIKFKSKHAVTKDERREFKQRDKQDGKTNRRNKHGFKAGVLLVMIYLYGAGITMFITHVSKYATGRLRPHFHDICKPIWSKINCTNEFGATNYIIGDTFCKPLNNDMLKEARLSFPSGQASFGAFSATFLIMYLEKDVNFKSNRWVTIPKIFAQAMVSSFAIYVGFTRVSDYKNHVSDVLVGFLLGILIGVFIYFSSVKLVLEEPKMKDLKEEKCMAPLMEVPNQSQLQSTV